MLMLTMEVKCKVVLVKTEMLELVQTVMQIPSIHPTNFKIKKLLKVILIQKLVFNQIKEHQ